MKNLIVTAAVLTTAAVFVSAATAQSSSEVTLTRIDCGSGAGPRDITAFSDTHAYDGKKQQLTVSCYLIRHGTDYMIWDTGYPTEGMPHASPTDQKAKVSLVSQLAQVNVKPEQIKYVGISHY